MKEKNVKKIGIIIGIVLFIGMILGLSYAFYQGKISVGGISGTIGCFNIDYVKGNNVNGDLLLYDENEIINGNNITIKNGMAVTNVSAGINSGCKVDAYLTINLTASTLSNAFISGNSIGALKYVIAEYDPSTYPTVNSTALNNESFTILKQGSVTTKNKHSILNENLTQGTMNNYLVIFYIDGDLAMNDAGHTTFSASIEAIATQGKFTGAAFISSQFIQNDTVTEGDNATTDQIDTTHQLIKDQAGNIRYYGTGITNTGGTYKEPNNYIDIGDRDSSDNPILWRIIGVFDGKLKLIRSTYITADNDSGLSWDTSASTVNSGYGINEWSQADLMKLLNPGHEDNQDLNSSGSTIKVNNSLWYAHSSGDCYTGQSNAITSCNFTSTGLSDSVKDKIAEVTWNLGGWNNTQVYPNLIYDKERGTTVYTGTGDGITRTTSWTGKIGLAYPSDYGYATDLSQCNKNLYNYSNTGTNNTYPCRGNNWMWYTMTGATAASSSGSKGAWLLTPRSDYARNAWSVFATGNVHGNNVLYSYAVSPVLYLKPEIIIDGGAGTSSNPYTLYEPPKAAETISNLFSKTGTATSNSISHDVDTTHQLIKDPAGNIRYYGTGINSSGSNYSEPNNYVDIGDNELWRIIGVFKNTQLSDGSIADLIKIVRNSSIGNYAWDDGTSLAGVSNSSNNDSSIVFLQYNNEEVVAKSMAFDAPDVDCSNDWSIASLKNILNSGSYYSSGITQSAKNKIVSVVWNLGAFSNDSSYPNQIYNSERGTRVSSGNSLTWTGKIALSYASDYGYATDLSKCTQSLDNYSGSENNSACRGNNWMWYSLVSSTNNAWLLDSDAFNRYAAHIISSNGGLDYHDSSIDPNGSLLYTFNSHSVNPASFLNPNLSILSGSGTQSSPYVIG